MEKEKGQPEETPEQKIEIPEQPEEILKVNPEDLEKEKAEEKIEAENLKKQIEQAFAGVETSPTEKPDLPARGFKEESTHERGGIIKKWGIRLGQSLGWVADSIRGRVDNFDIQYFGGENIKELEGKPYLLAVNHIKPKNIAMQAMGLSPDSFVLEKIGAKEGKIKPKIITNVTGKISKVPVLGLLDKVWSPFREGIMEGMGFIPVKTKKGGKQGGFNRNFIKNIRKAKKNGEPIIIFPQGHWSRKFNPDLPFDTGTATIARNYDLPVVPAYIEWADSWRRGQKVSVSIGQSIESGEKTKEEITAEIKSAIIALSKNEQQKSFGDNTGI